MTKEFIYISTDDKGKYHLRYRMDIEGYAKDIDTISRIGGKVVRCFDVPCDLVSATMDLCSEFIKQKISLEDNEQNNCQS